MLALGVRSRLPQEPCQEVLPWDGVPLPCRGEERGADGRGRDLVPSATSSLQGGGVDGGVHGASSNNGIFPPPHLDLSDVSSETCLLVGAEGMCMTALANAACADSCSVLPVHCYQWSLLPISCPSPCLGIPLPALQRAALCCR